MKLEKRVKYIKNKIKQKLGEKLNYVSNHINVSGLCISINKQSHKCIATKEIIDKLD